jgi:hypothetical protein
MLTTILLVFSIVVDIGIGARAMVKFSGLDKRFAEHEAQDKVEFAGLKAQIEALHGKVE